MKKILTIALLAASLAVSAQAVIVGFEAGYLTDNNDAYFSARIGHEVKADTSLSHQLEAEIGYTEHSEAISLGLAPGDTVTSKTKLTPLTLNYRVEMARTDKLGFYFGAGIGVARVSFGFPGSGRPWISSSDNVLALQGFAGVTYKATATTSLHLGLKYLWIDDVKVMGVSAAVGDDLAIMAGVSFKF